MKINKKFAIVLPISLLLLAGCVRDFPEITNEAFNINIYGYPNVNLTFDDNSNDNEVELEIYNHYFVHLLIEDSKYNDNVRQNISFAYDENKFDFSYYDTNESSKSVSYSLVPCQLDDESEFKIIYENKEYIIDIKIVDFDFASHLASKPNISDLENNYPAFKEMIDAIEYHEFTSPFLGMDPDGIYGGSDYWSRYTYVHDFDETYDVGYLDYLTDSIYYPTSMNMALPNIASREMTMTFDNLNKVEEGASQSTIADFNVGVNAVDVEHTNPTNSLLNINFHAVPLEYESESESINTMMNNYFHQTYYLLKQEYADQYLQYAIGDISISIIEIGEKHLQGYFADETYSYQLSCTYV